MNRIAALLFLTIVVSCTKYTDDTPLLLSIRGALGNNEEITKTTLDETTFQLAWKSGDEICIADGEESKQYQCNTAGKVVDFYPKDAPITSVNSIVGIYPSSAFESYSRTNETIRIILPETRTISEAHGIGDCIPLIAKSNDQSGKIVFNNCLGLLRIGITTNRNNVKVKHLQLSTQRSISGNTDITFDINELPEAECKGNNSIEINYCESVAIGRTTHYFYFMLPPATYKDVILTIDGDNYQHQSVHFTHPIIITRGHITTKNVVADEMYIDIAQINSLESGLMDKENANCYLVSQPGEYMFDATVCGNSNVKICPKSASVLWSTYNTGTSPIDNNRIIRDVYYDNGKVYFRTPNELCYGSSIIAVYSGENCTGSVLWSWHIWSVDYNPGQIFDTYNGWDVMDRNLGALASVPGADSDENVLSLGFMYQWGRKDPFTGPRWYRSYQYQKTTTYFLSKDITPETGTIEYSVQHPTEIMTNLRTPYDWLNESNNDLWGANSNSKTMYDPCPPGWRVPSYSVFNDFFEYDGNKYLNFEIVYSGSNHGAWYKSKVWYPTTGYRKNDGVFLSSESTGYYWLSSYKLSGRGDYMSFMKNGVGEYFVASRNTLYRSYMAAIRCGKPNKL